MTAEELIMYLAERIGRGDLNVRSEISWGSCWDRRTPMDPDDLEIREGEVFLNTYEGM